MADRKTLDEINDHIVTEGTAWARRVPLATLAVVILSLAIYPFSAGFFPGAEMTFLAYIPLSAGVVGAVLGMFVRQYWLGAANLVVGALVPPVILVVGYVL